MPETEIAALNPHRNATESHFSLCYSSLLTVAITLAIPCKFGQPKA